MAEDKHKMQADGSGTKQSPPDRNGEVASRRATPEQGSESSGRSYPNPRDKGGKDEDSGDFKGGQSNQAYFGKGRLGEKDVGKTENAPSTED